MKVSIARIKLILKTGKVLADGSNPIMVSLAYNGKKFISTGYSCLPKYWDKQSECVKKGCPNYLGINKAISDIKAKYVERRNELEASGMPYTVQMLAEKEEKVVANDGDVRNLISDYIEKHHLGFGTKKGWIAFRDVLLRFAGRDLVIYEVDEAFTKRYAAYMKKEGNSDGYIRRRLSQLGALYNHAVEEGLAKVDNHPFKHFKFRRKYQKSNKLATVHQSTVEVMKKVLLDAIVVDNGKGLWHYKEGAVEDLVKCSSKIFPLFFWLLMYRFQGLSPIDICFLKKSDFKVIKVGDKEYYSLSVARSKTGKVAQLRIPTEGMLNQVLTKTWLLFNSSSVWYCPVFNGLEDASREKLEIRLNKVMANRTNKILKEVWLPKINEIIIDHNARTGDIIPLIPSDCTLYTARHSFALAYLSNGGSLIGLATLLGRSVDTISTYASSLTEDADIVAGLDVL